MRTLARVAAIIAAALLCGWAFLEWAYEPLACNIALTDLTRRTNLIEQSRGHYERIARARRNLEELRALPCETDVQLHVLIAANEESLGQYDDAAAAYRAALLVDRRPEVYALMGDALVQLGRTDEAVENYVIAARFTPYILERVPSTEVERRVKERLAGREAPRTTSSSGR